MWQRDVMPKTMDQPSRTKQIVAWLASVAAAIAVISALITNVKTIADAANSVFGFDVGPKTVKVCMGNGGGNNCLGGADAKFDCDHYKAMGGGGQKTIDTLQTQFCPSKRANVTVYQNNGGGECGWTGFDVTCKRWWWPF
jgi:hypothetical protein